MLLLLLILLHKARSMPPQFRLLAIPRLSLDMPHGPQSSRYELKACERQCCCWSSPQKVGTCMKQRPQQSEDQLLSEDWLQVYYRRLPNMQPVLLV